MNIISKRNISHQQGASVFTTLMVVILIGLVAMSGLKIVPAYMDNSVIVGAMEGLVEENEVAEMRVRDIRDALSKTLLANGMRDFDYENVELINEKGSEYVSINYETRVPIFYNIEAVVIFTNRFDL